MAREDWTIESEPPFPWIEIGEAVNVPKIPTGESGNFSLRMGVDGESVASNNLIPGGTTQVVARFTKISTDVPALDTGVIGIRFEQYIKFDENITGTALGGIERVPVSEVFSRELPQLPNTILETRAGWPDWAVLGLTGGSIRSGAGFEANYLRGGGPSDIFHLVRPLTFRVGDALEGVEREFEGFVPGAINITQNPGIYKHEFYVFQDPENPDNIQTGERLVQVRDENGEEVSAGEAASSQAEVIIPQIKLFFEQGVASMSGPFEFCGGPISDQEQYDEFRNAFIGTLETISYAPDDEVPSDFQEYLEFWENIFSGRASNFVESFSSILLSEEAFALEDYSHQVIFDDIKMFEVREPFAWDSETIFVREPPDLASEVFACADFEQEWFEGWEPENIPVILPPEGLEGEAILTVNMNNNWLNGWEPSVAQTVNVV